MEPGEDSFTAWGWGVSVGTTTLENLLTVSSKVKDIYSSWPRISTSRNILTVQSTHE